MARILFLVIGFGKPSSKKRVLGSLGHLRSAGHDVEAVEVPSGLFGRASMLARLGSFDLVVIQKKLFGRVQLGLIRAANENILYDLDDAVMFHEIERGEPLTGKWFSRFAHTASSCRGVIAGNNYLAEFARASGAPEVAVLPTPVDTEEITPAERESGSAPVIGWLGTKGNLAHLARIAGALSEVLAKCPAASLRVVSNSRPEIPGVGFEYKAWSAEDESADLAGFDIGVMPLDDDLWTRGKGGYKLLQYMAAGVASVASPVGINREIIRHGENGFLAGDVKEWTDALCALAGDGDLRKRMGLAARRTVERGYSLEAYNRGLAGFIERFV